jgi:hypothetical protein
MLLEKTETELNVDSEFVQFKFDKNTYIISTMPRSGTHYTVRFLHNLDYLMLKTNIDEEFAYRHPHNYFSGIGANILLNHYTSPLMHRPLIAGLMLDQFRYWKTLSYNVWNPVSVVESLNVISHGFYTEKARIIFIYRNPLDQVVSSIDHYMNHKDISVSGISKTQLANALLGSYFKMFFTHFAAMKLCPIGTYFVRYEDLIQRPTSAWSWIVSKLLDQTDVTALEFEIQSAIDRSNYGSAEQWEATYNRSLANDQVGDHPTHLHGGEVGKWKNYLDQESIELCDKHISGLGIPRNMFVFE